MVTSLQLVTLCSNSMYIFALLSSVVYEFGIHGASDNIHVPVRTRILLKRVCFYTVYLAYPS